MNENHLPRELARAFPMTPANFLHSLESVLQHRRVSFSRADAIAFFENCWGLIADDPDVWFWLE